MNNQNNNMPVVQPAVADVFGHGWETLKKYFPELLLILVVEVLLSLPMGLTSIMFDVMTDDGIVMMVLFQILYGFLVILPITYGISWIYLKAVRGEPFKVQDIFLAYQSFGQVLIANILMGLIIGLGVMMLIVPGIIFACKLAFVPYLVVDRKLDATDAIRTSWQMTNGHAGTIFMMGIASIFVVLLGLICLLVGVIPAGIWVSLAFAAMFMAVEIKEKQANPPA